MTPVFSFLISGEDGEELEVAIDRMDDTDEYLVIGPDDVAMPEYPDLLRDAVQAVPAALDEALDVAARLWAEYGVLGGIAVGDVIE